MLKCYMLPDTALGVWNHVSDGEVDIVRSRSYFWRRAIRTLSLDFDIQLPLIMLISYLWKSMEEHCVSEGRYRGDGQESMS